MRFNRASNKLLNLIEVELGETEYEHEYNHSWDWDDDYYYGDDWCSECGDYHEDIHDDDWIYRYDASEFDVAKEHKWNCKCHVCKGEAEYRISTEEKRDRLLSSLLDDKLAYPEIKKLEILRELIINRNRG